MPESHAEQLDPSVLGEEVGDRGRPGDRYPPDEPLAVEDETITPDGSIGRDDVAGRDERTTPDPAADVDAGPEQPVETDEPAVHRRVDEELDGDRIVDDV